MASLPLPLWFPPLTRTNHLRPFTITAGLAARRVPESGGDCGSADIRLGVAAAAFLFYWPFGLRILCALVAALIEWSCACLAFHLNSSSSSFFHLQEGYDGRKYRDESKDGRAWLLRCRSLLAQVGMGRDAGMKRGEGRRTESTERVILTLVKF